MLGALAAINSAAAAVSPMIGSALRVAVSGRPVHDWRIGASFNAASFLPAFAASNAAITFRADRSRSRDDR